MAKRVLPKEKHRVSNDKIDIEYDLLADEGVVTSLLYDMSVGPFGYSIDLVEQNLECDLYDTCLRYQEDADSYDASFCFRIQEFRGGLQIERCFRLDPDGVVKMWIELANKSSRPIRLSRVSLLKMSGGIDLLATAESQDIWIYRQIRDMIHQYGRCSVLNLSEQTGEISCDWLGLFCSKNSDRAVAFSFSTAKGQFATVDMKIEGGKVLSLNAGCNMDGLLLEEGDSIATETLSILFGTPFDILEKHSAAIAENLLPRVLDRPPSGWLSWYYYYENISEAALLDNVIFLAKHKDEFPIRFVQVDKGYESAVGDWMITNERFPHGLKFLADRIREAGFEAGIWVAPFAASTRSRLFHEHQDWFLTDANDQMIITPGWDGEGSTWAPLDGSNPAVQEYYEELFSCLVKDCGFTYLKLDGLSWGVLNGKRFKSGMTSFQAFRAGLQAIRKGAGNSCVILGCTCPFYAGIGLVDAMRVSPDVSALWEGPPGQLGYPAMANAMRETLHRYFMNRKFFVNDPDALIVRSLPSQHGPETIGVSVDEARFLATSIAMSGGTTFFSEDMLKLEEQRRRIISQILPSFGVAATPVDFFHKAYPEVLRLNVSAFGEEYLLVAVFNWSNECSAIKLNLKEFELAEDFRYHVWEFWNKVYLGTTSDMIELGRRPPHSVGLYCIRKVAERPQLVSTDIHFTQGAEEFEEVAFRDHCLSFVPRRLISGNAWIFVPVGYDISTIRGAVCVGIEGAPGGRVVQIALERTNSRIEIVF